MPNSQYGPGFFIRLVILLLILAMVAVSFVVDMTFKGPKSAELVQKVNKLLETETDDGHGISKDMIQKAIGLNPDNVHDVGKFEVEQYSFRRTIPFFTLRNLFVVYDDGGAVTLFEQQSLPTEQMIKRQLGPDIFDPGVPPPDKLPRAAGGGPPVPSNDDEKKKSEGKSEDKSEEKSADPANPGDDKKDGENAPAEATDKESSSKDGNSENKEAAPAEAKPDEKKPDDAGGGQSDQGDKKPDEGKGG